MLEKWRKSDCLTIVLIECDTMDVHGILLLVLFPFFPFLVVVGVFSTLRVVVVSAIFFFLRCSNTFYESTFDS